jgi:hypothetical protein
MMTPSLCSLRRSAWISSSSFTLLGRKARLAARLPA